MSSYDNSLFDFVHQGLKHLGIPNSLISVLEFCISMGIIIYFAIIFCYMSVLNLKADDMLSQHKFINDSTTLVSAGKRFELGFFSTPGNSKNRYLGIWHNIAGQTIVWVANRNNPLNDSSGVLKIGDDANLILQDQTNRVIWSTRIQAIPSKPPIVAQLLDSGNLVLRGENTSYSWQSFDHPSDTLLSGMKLGWDLRIGLNRYLTSWRNIDDPSPGEYLYGIDLHGLPQGVLRKNSVKKFRTGSWNGVVFQRSRVNPNIILNFTFVINSEEVYYENSIDDQLTRLVATYSGTLQRFVWKNTSQEWVLMYTHPSDPCDSYGRCGSNAICTINNPKICSCLAGYIPKSAQDWEIMVWSGGCVRKNPLNCPVGEGFIELKGVETPDLLQFYGINTSLTLKECEVECLKNCSCTAYSLTDIAEGKSACVLWYGDLIDIKRYSDSVQNLYIRATASELELRSDANKKKRLISVMIPVSIAILLLLLASCIMWKRRTQRQGDQPDIPSKGDDNIELPIFSVVTIAEATNNFSYSNKIGEGGFGSVYKGQLSTGQEIAVKRLSENSNQGLREFKNEVILISKLQHQNLVRLLGCCIQGEERMLIYEYMPNGSLSSFMFDNRRSNSLTWSRRFNIIVGIARGLLYLHRDSRLRIIHRDLKASNVLLDSEKNPKISDFGIARAFQGDQLSATTKTVIGTYGYMSPEYVNHGHFSMKSDVFSFGVLVLEIVCGKRNREFCHHRELNLIGHAWKLWIEGKAIELVDEDMEDSLPMSQVLRCIQVGLLCVQRRPEDRLTISSVLLGLDSESAMLPQPKEPGFFTEWSTNEMELSLDGTQCATNQMTSTLLEGR